MQRQKSNRGDILLTQKQAKRAVVMCLNNSTDFLDDTFALYRARLNKHLPVSIEFAVEELGKAKVILDKLSQVKQPNDKIVLKKSDCIFDHEAKIEAGIQMLDLDFQKLSQSLNLAGTSYDHIEYPIGKAQVDSALQNFIEQVRKGHNVRLESSFVYFDLTTNEPKIGHSVDMSYFMKVHTAINDRVKKLQKELTPAKGFTLR